MSGQHSSMEQPIAEQQIDHTNEKPESSNGQPTIKQFINSANGEPEKNIVNNETSIKQSAVMNIVIINLLKTMKKNIFLYFRIEIMVLMVQSYIGIYF